MASSAGDSIVQALTYKATAVAEEPPGYSMASSGEDASNADKATSHQHPADQTSKSKQFIAKKKFQAGRKRISLEQKRLICQYKIDHPNVYSREIFLHFRRIWPAVVAPSTISKILANSAKWMSTTAEEEKKQRMPTTRVYHPRHRSLEAALYLWYMTFRDQMNINNEMLKEKAVEIGKELKLRRFQCSNKWLHCFKKRHDILKFKQKAKGPRILSIDLDYAYDTEVESEDPTMVKVSYGQDESGDGTLHVTSPVSLEEARQGLMNTMGYLAAHPTIARNYIDLLWDVFQQIVNKPPMSMSLDEEVEYPDQNADNTGQQVLNILPDGNPEDALNRPELLEEIPVPSTKRGENETSVAELLGALSRTPTKTTSSSSAPANQGATIIDNQQTESYQLPIPNLETDAGHIQYAVQGADGEYILVLAETENGQDVDLAKSLPDILSAAGHSAGDGTQFIETIDPDTGLRTISIADKQQSTNPGKTLIEIVNSNSQSQGSDSIQDSTVTTATNISSDHQYMSATGDDESENKTVKNVEPIKSTGIENSDGSTTSKTVGPLKVTMGDQTYDLVPIDSNGEELKSKGVEEVEKVVKPSTSLPESENTDLKKPDIIKPVEVSDSEDMVDDVGSDDDDNDNDDNVSSVDTLEKSTNLAKCTVKIQRLPKVLESPKDSKPHVCQVCQKVFPCFAHMKAHQRIHLNMKPKPVIEEYQEGKRGYQCNVCSMVFNRHTSYKAHMSHHTGECQCSACALERKNEATGSPYSRSPSRSGKAGASLGSPHLKISKVTSLEAEEDMEEEEMEEDIEEDMEEYIAEEDMEEEEMEEDDVKPHICQTCGRCFTRAQDLTLHSHVHAVPRCTTCKMILPNLRELREHMKEHEQKTQNLQPIKCKQCDKYFNRPQDLRKHALIHKEGELDCMICEKTFSNRANLRKHLRLHTGIEDYYCSRCELTFVDAKSLKDHLRLHTEEEPKRRCPYCDKGFKIERNLDFHILYNHKQKESSGTDEAYSCDQCDRTFVLERNLRTHQALKHPFPSAGSRVEIKKTEQGDKVQDKTNDTVYSCDQCAKSFILARNLKMHVKIAHGARRAPIGSISKLSVRDRRPAMISHKRFKCNLCEKGFDSLRKLQEHKLQRHRFRPKKTTTGPSSKKEHLCLTCHKTFTDFDAFRVHIKNHIEERLYKCPVCEKLFKNAKDIKNHVLIHTGEKSKKSAKLQIGDKPKKSDSFSCTICDRTFSELSKLHGHMSVHSKKREGGHLYECKICGKNLGHSVAYKEHMESHKSTKLSCSICNVQFKYKQNLKRHLMNKHPKQK